MSTECYPITVLPHLSRLFREFTEMRAAPADAPVRGFYSASPFDDRWKQGTSPRLQPDRGTMVDLLAAQNRSWNASDPVFQNLEKLRAGARAVVTGQQVGLFGGPLLMLMKAATAVRKAQVASAAGVPHVPIFWMATEDHDLAEVNQITLLSKDAVETLHSRFPHHGVQEVGGLHLGDEIMPVLERVEELLGFAPVCDLLRNAYTPDATLASAFAKLIGGLFGKHGLIVIDASTRDFHRLGATVLRYAIEHADELHDTLAAKSSELEAAGYHAQVLIAKGSSLLFLVNEKGDRLPLRRVLDGSTLTWKAGNRTYADADLLQVLEAEPERLSPNALLRPIFQDALLPTSAYIGGPAEIAYFAQCRPIYEAILGNMTPILPRLSATLVDRATGAVMQQHELSLQDVLQPEMDLLQKLGARAIPIEGKRRIANAGNALNEELAQVTHWMESMDTGLGRSAEVAASKMRYQMNRLRRLAANWQIQRETHLAKHAGALSRFLYPDQHPQERLLAGVYLIAKSSMDLPSLLVEHAEQDCPGHRVIAI